MTTPKFKNQTANQLVFEAEIRETPAGLTEIFTECGNYTLHRGRGTTEKLIVREGGLTVRVLPIGSRARARMDVLEAERDGR
jgi:hypothetical protein